MGPFATRARYLAWAATTRGIPDALAALLDTIDKPVGDIFAATALENVCADRFEVENRVFAKNDGETLDHHCLARVAKSGSLPC